ncbi:hypothetical protein [Amycolatopsis thermoflava]
MAALFGLLAEPVDGHLSDRSLYRPRAIALIPVFLGIGFGSLPRRPATAT